MMAYYLLYRCAVTKQRVVVLKAGWQINAPHLFCEEGVFKLNVVSLNQELNRPDVLCVHNLISLAESSAL
jgi:hypothetical protein